MTHHIAIKPTTWIFLAGLPATGKSTLARALAKRLEKCVILDKDTVRATLFPGAMTDYTAEQNDLCMRVIYDAAGYLTRHRLADFILIDGRTFSSAAQLAEALDAASKARASQRILHLICSDKVAAARLRVVDPDHPGRDRDIELYRQVKAKFEPILRPKLDLDTSSGVDNLVDRAIEYIHS
jgi:adenylylsulfate kinase